MVQAKTAANASNLIRALAPSNAHAARTAAIVPDQFSFNPYPGNELDSL